MCAGLLESKEAHQMQGMIEKRLKNLVHSPTNIKLPEPRVLLREHLVF